MPPKSAPKKKLANTKTKASAAESQPVQNEFLNDLYDVQIKKDEKKIKDLEKELEEKTRQLNGSAAEIEKLKKELTTHQRNISGSVLCKDEEKAEHESLQRYTKENENLRKQLEEKTKEQNRSAAEIERLKKELTKQGTSAGNTTQEKEYQLQRNLKEKEEKEKELLRNISNQSKPNSEEAKRSKDNSEVENLKEQLENERKKSKDEIEKMKENHKKEMERTNDEMEKLKKNHENEIKRLTSDAEKSRSQMNDLQELEKKYKEEKSRVEQLTKENKELQEDIEKRKELSKNNKPMKNFPSGEIASLKQENETLKNRLSQLAGAKLTEGNPNIADLSDKNRPTNLAEHFSELYDNEWTDALEELTETESKTEEDGIRILFDIIKDAYEFSCKQATVFYNSVSKGLEGFGLENPDKWPQGLSKQVKDHRKSISVLVAGNLSKAFLKNQKKNFGKVTAKYAEACAALCLFMCVQDPAVYIDSNKPKGKFDKDKYRAYTKSGEEYAFLVWPPLFLHKDGPLLGKGIAQGLK